MMKGVFPNDLKLVDITPIFKKEDSLNKENYWPAGILPHLSTAFERIIYKLIDSFMENKCSRYLYASRKKQNTQSPLLKTIEN